MTRGGRALTITLVVSLSWLSLSACSDGSDEERAAAALKAEMVANAGMTTGRNVNDAQTSCVTRGMVDEMGVDTLQGYDLLTDDLRSDRSIQGVTLSADDADTLAQVFDDCMDVEAMMEKQIIAGLGLPARQQRRAARCVREHVTAGQVRRTMSLEFQGVENPVFKRLRAQLRSCLD
jgi:hypothetical protein